MRKIIIVLIAFILSITFSAQAAPPVDLGPHYVEGELLVKYKDERTIARVHAKAGALVAGRFKHIKIDHIKLPPGLSVTDAIREYQKDPTVEFAEPNYIARKSVTPSNDPRLADQWGLANISASAAWDLATGGTVTVAVLDTGIYYPHPDLAGNLWTDPTQTVAVYGANFNNGVVTSDPLDDDIADSHGTHVSGIIGAVGNNGVGVSGINWTVKIMAVKVLHGSAGEGSVSDVVAGMQYAVENGARVVNCSLEIAGYSYSLENAIMYADAQGVLVVSAAGNGGKNNDASSVSPASVRTANNIAVAATTSSDALPSYSDYGKATVEVAAPGGALPQYTPSGVLSTTHRCLDANYDNICDLGDNPVTGYDYIAGTSMAAPHVTGLAALIWSQNPALTHYQVKARIMNGVDKLAGLSGKTITGGRINAYTSLAQQTELPAVFKVSPYSTAAGGTVTITGANFGNTMGTLTLATVSMLVTSWADTIITATVPDDAVSGAVQVNGQGSTFPLTIWTSPTVTLIAEPATGFPPLNVIFTAQAADLDGTIVKYEWDNGLGTFVYDPKVTSSAIITYYQPGIYTARVRVTDDNGLTAIGSVQIVVFSNGGSDGHWCFIATAAYGSSLAPQVQALREFRDRHLLTNAWGRAFVSFYYRYSPPAAEYISRHEPARVVARWLLAPVVLIIQFPVLAGAGLLLLFVSRLMLKNKPKSDG
jgi:subtilisin family serine protease